MAERLFERELRAMLARDLDAVHGPHRRWVDAPVARRIEEARGAARRWPAFAALAAASLAAVAMVAVFASRPATLPAATGAPNGSASIEPWPAYVAPNTAPTVGEVPLGRVAVVTQSSAPVLLMRVSPTTSTAGGVAVRVELRVVAPLQEPVGIQRLIVIRNGQREAPGLGVSGADPLALAVGVPVGTETGTVVSIPAATNENVLLGFISSRSQLAFWFTIHAVVAAPTLNGCPALADYQATAAAPSMTPAPPSFAPVAADTKPSAGVLTPGQVGVVAAPDGSPGALFRVSNPRFCDRLPNERLEMYFGRSLPGDYRLILADVEFTVLKSGSLDRAFIPGNTIVWAKWRQSNALAVPVPYDFPGSNPRTSLALSAGFSYRGVMSWIVEGAGRGGRIVVEVGPHDTPDFEYLIQDGSTDNQPGGPLETLAPGATPSTGALTSDSWAVLAADGALVPVFVGGVATVDGYPRVMPRTPGDKFIEVFVRFGQPTGPYTVDASDWVLVGSDGRDLPRLKDPGTPDNALLPPFAIPWAESRQVGPADGFYFPLYPIAEVAPTGRITLEYRPHGGRAQVTWIVRDH